jgi:hypothetical protein
MRRILSLTAPVALAAASLAISLVALAPTSAAARTGANPEGRFLRSPEGAILSLGRAYAARPVASQATTVLVPLPSGAVLLDSTYYDLQDMGSLGTRIVVGPDGRVHVTWQDDLCEIAPGGCPPNLALPQPFPMRGMVYATRDPGGAWHNLSKVADPRIRGCCVTELFGGFGGIALAPSGKIAISQHLNEEGCDLRGNFYLQDAVGGSTWQAHLTPIQSPSYLFPQIAATSGGSFVTLGEVPIGGSYDETEQFAISRVATPGAAFVCPVGWQSGPWTTIVPLSTFRGNKPAFPAIAAGADGRVGIAVGDFGGNVFLIESSDGTFAGGTVTIRNLTNTTDAQVTVGDSTSTAYRSYVHCAIAYNDTTPNVVWSELQARRVGGNVEFFDHRSRIVHWSSTRGVSVVKQVQPGEADRFDDVDQLLSGPLGGFNTLAVDWPQVGFSPDGNETYVAWLRCSDAEVDPTADMGLPGIITGVGFTDICASVAVGAGAWTPAQNLTNTPQTDERFFSLAARNPDGKAHIVLQASVTNEAGCVVIGDRGGSPGNILRRIAYLEAPLVGSLIAVGDAPAAAPAALRAWPNPARSGVSFRLPDGSRRGSIDVVSVEGRLVARVAVTRGEGRWDGRDASGSRAPAGLYFARVTGGGEGSTTRFMLLD